MRLCLLIFSVLLLQIVLLSVGCAGSASDKKAVTVTIMPQKYFADKIAGGLVDVNCVVPSGANPENYDPAPNEIAAAARSDAYFKVGNLGFEVSSLNKIAENNPSMKIFDTSKGVEMLLSHCSHEGEEHSADKGDPHIWSSPKAAMIMARNIYEGLLEIDPDNKEGYTANYNELLSQIDSVDQVVAAKMKRHSGEVFAIFHPSLTYFANDYGLIQLTLERDGKELTALTLKEAVVYAKNNKVEVVFIQNEFNPSQVETFAAEVGGRVKVINPLDYNWPREIIRVADAFE